MKMDSFFVLVGTESSCIFERFIHSPFTKKLLSSRTHQVCVCVSVCVCERERERERERDRQTDRENTQPHFCCA